MRDNRIPTQKWPNEGNERVRVSLADGSLARVGWVIIESRYSTLSIAELIECSLATVSVNEVR